MVKELSVPNESVQNGSTPIDERELADRFIEKFLTFEEADRDALTSLKDVAEYLIATEHRFAGLIIKNTVLRWESGLPLSPHVEIGDGLIHEPLSCTVAVNGSEVKLTPVENRLLFYFRTHTNTPIKHTELKQLMGGFFEYSSIRNYVMRLRGKIEQDPQKPTRIIASARYYGEYTYVVEPRK